MYGAWRTIPLDSLGVLRAHGPDTLAFLQGQLSNDLAQLSPARALLAGYHNPQGRVIALLQLLAGGDAQLLALLPRELVDATAQRLTKYVLRSKVRISDESAAWQVHGVIAPAGAAAPAGWPASADCVIRWQEAHLVCRGTQPLRWLWVAPAGGAAPVSALPGAGPGDESVWRAQLIAAGEPQVYVATSEEFVAQMLNLDVLGAIAFDKGCYTGQEVIARAHYRGRVKRRLQRFLSHSPVSLAPGESGTLGDGRAFKVVHASARADARCEFLAVTSLSAAAADAAGAAVATARLEASPLELPYPLPE
jgi:tRNA-modifying protein YgfZ